MNDGGKLHFNSNIPTPPLHHPKRTTNTLSICIRTRLRLAEHITQIPHHALRLLPRPKVAARVIVAVEDQRTDLAIPCRGYDSQLARLMAVADGDVRDPFAGAETGGRSEGAVRRWRGRRMGRFVVDAEGGGSGDDGVSMKTSRLEDTT